MSGNHEAAGMFILSGSSRHQLLENAEESLAGRIGIIDMDPLTISEVMKRKNLPFLSDIGQINARTADHSFLFDNVFDYIVKGMMPQLYDDPETSRSVFFLLISLHILKRTCGNCRI